MTTITLSTVNENVLLDFLNRLEDKIDKANEKLWHNSSVIDAHTNLLASIEAQTIKTNGRVTSLEATTAKLAVVESQNSGLIKASQDRIEASTKDIEGIHRVIDEVKKSLGVVEVIHSTESVDKRRTWLEIIKHSITALVTLLAGWLGLQLTK